MLRLLSAVQRTFLAGTQSPLKGEKDPHPQDFSLTKETARFTKGQDFHFLPQNPRTPEGVQKGFVKGSLKGFRRVLEGVS